MRVELNNKSKQYIKQLLISSGLSKISSKYNRSRVVILRYHSVLEDPGEFDKSIGRGIIHTASAFNAHMRLLSKEYDPVTIDQVFAFVKGQECLPKRAVAVTFDDGFADNAEVAAPIMNLYSIKGAFYVITGSIDSAIPPWFLRLRSAFNKTTMSSWVNPQNGIKFDLNDSSQRYDGFYQASAQSARLCGEEQCKWMDSIESSLRVLPPAKRGGFIMSESQIKRLHAQGHIIGSHTISHPNIAYINEREAYEEMSKSRQHLERIIESPVIHFAYPSPILQPHWNTVTEGVALKAGYATSMTCIPGSVFIGDDLLALKRISIPEDITGFQWIIDSLLSGVCPS